MSLPQVDDVLSATYMSSKPPYPPVSSSSVVLSDTSSAEVTPSSCQEEISPSQEHPTPCSSASAVSESLQKRHTESARSIIPRPPNAWIIYRSAKIRERPDTEWKALHQHHHDQISSATASHESSQTASSTSSSTQRVRESWSRQAFCSKRVADMWKVESKQVKEYYYELAHQKKLQHEQMFPGYKFRPRRDAQARPLHVDLSKKDPDRVNKTGKKKRPEKIKTVKDNGGSVESRNTENVPITKNLDSREESSVSNHATTIDSGVIRNRPASTAKVKARGPPDLSIDVFAAEQNTDFSFTKLMEMPLIDGSGSSSFSQECASREWASPIRSHEMNLQKQYINNSLASSDIDKTIDCDVQDTAYDLSCPPLSQMASAIPWINDSAAPWATWTASPLDLEPIEMPLRHTTEDIISKEQREPSKDDTSQSDSPSLLQCAKKKSQRKKSPPNVTSKRQSKGKAKEPVFALPSAESPRKKLKKAMICKDPQKILALKEKSKEGKNEVSRQIGNGSKAAYQQVQAGHSAVTLDDQHGNDTELEQALLCAEALVESFAGMAAWSPHQAWFSGLLTGDEGSVVTEQQTGAAKSNAISDGAAAAAAAAAWDFYSHPSSEIMTSTSQYKWPSSGPAQDVPRGTDDGKAAVDALQGVLFRGNETPLLPQLITADDVTKSTEESDYLQLTSYPAFTPWGPPSPPRYPLYNNTDFAAADLFCPDTAISDQDWNSLLAQTILCAPSTDPTDKGDAIEHLNNGSSESVWNLMRFDSASQPSPDLHAHPVTTAPERPMIANGSAAAATASLEVSLPQGSTAAPPTNVPFVELNGTFTENQLLEKLRILQRSSSQSHAPG